MIKNPVVEAEMEQSEKAKLFRALHKGPKLLVLPNCWDAISAKVFAHSGAQAVATASASISWARGVRDGEGLSLGDMIDAVALICNSVDVPVTADMEKGFGETPKEVGQAIAAAIAAGVVGINIEDSIDGGKQRPIADMQERVSATRQAGVETGVEIYINARVDGYLLGLAGKSKEAGEQVFKDTVTRGKAWLEAGADCVFVPGVADINIISQLVGEIGGPVSVIIMDENTPTVSQLTDAGVVRISTGPRPMQAAMGCLQGIVPSIIDNGDFRFMKGVPGFGELQNL